MTTILSNPSSLAQIFVIQPNTTKAWNSPVTMIETYIGQTLTIQNNDTITHEMHTTNNVPCVHGSPISAGQSSSNCVITAAYDYTSGILVYDHL